jgi:hypothetical protein
MRRPRVQQRDIIIRLQLELAAKEAPHGSGTYYRDFHDISLAIR